MEWFYSLNSRTAKYIVYKLLILPFYHIWKILSILMSNLIVIILLIILAPSYAKVLSVNTITTPYNSNLDLLQSVGNVGDERIFICGKSSIKFDVNRDLQLNYLVSDKIFKDDESCKSFVVNHASEKLVLNASVETVTTELKDKWHLYVINSFSSGVDCACSGSGKVNCDLGYVCMTGYKKCSTAWSNPCFDSENVCNWKLQFKINHHEVWSYGINTISKCELMEKNKQLYFCKDDTINSVNITGCNFQQLITSFPGGLSDYIVVDKQIYYLKSNDQFFSGNYLFSRSLLNQGQLKEILTHKLHITTSCSNGGRTLEVNYVNLPTGGNNGDTSQCAASGVLALQFDNKSYSVSDVGSILTCDIYVNDMKETYITCNSSRNLIINSKYVHVGPHITYLGVSNNNHVSICGKWRLRSDGTISNTGSLSCFNILGEMVTTELDIDNYELTKFNKTTSVDSDYITIFGTNSESNHIFVLIILVLIALLIVAIIIYVISRHICYTRRFDKKKQEDIVLLRSC